MIGRFSKEIFYDFITYFLVMPKKFHRAIKTHSNIIIKHFISFLTANQRKNIARQDYRTDNLNGLQKGRNRKFFTFNHRIRRPKTCPTTVETIILYL